MQTKQNAKQTITAAQKPSNQDAARKPCNPPSCNHQVSTLAIALILAQKKGPSRHNLPTKPSQITYSNQTNDRLH
jgi:hypothetical protein